ncbi:MAG: hypothetical protein JXN59_01645 [Anaerolineae bacterium]|nr:hypothetical protein [Anaerolineae bacterium]
MDDDWLAALVALERAIVAYDDDPAPGPEEINGLAILTGRLPVLVSAPHAARHWRGTAWKREDEYTAALAHWLHMTTGAHALYPTHRITPDPHDDADEGHYKQALGRIVGAHGIRLVLDLHGARGDRDFGLALGTIYNETCPAYEAAIVEAFGAVGFRPGAAAFSLDRLALNPSRYAGGTRTPTVTRYAWRVLGVPAVQLEINAWARIVQRLPEAYEARQGIAPDFRGDPARIRRVMDGLLRVVGLVA